MPPARSARRLPRHRRSQLSRPWKFHSARFLLDFFSGHASPITKAFAHLKCNHFYGHLVRRHLFTPACAVFLWCGWPGLRGSSVLFLLSGPCTPGPCTSGRRSVSHPCGIPNLPPSGQAELARSSLLHSRTRELLALVASAGGTVVPENPTSSLLWLASFSFSGCTFPSTRLSSLPAWFGLAGALTFRSSWFLWTPVSKNAF